jgi:Fe-S-cluster containining protein
MNDFEMEVSGLKIDPKIFTYKFSCKCNGECCLYGVYTDLNEAKKIISIQEKILPLMDESQTKDVSKWFEAPEKDEDFESGVAVGTEINNHKCTFLDKNGLCTLQKLALKEGNYKWKYKPQYCILFPLTVFEGALTIDDEHIDRLKICNKNPMPELSIFEACKEELRHFLGDEDFNKLEKFNEEYLAYLKKKDVA